MATGYTGGSNAEDLFDFPCKFPIKAMGHNQDGFETLVRDIVLNHAVLFADSAIVTNASGAGKYLSVTIHIEAQSRAQLDRIYRDLSDCGQVLVAL